MASRSSNTFSSLPRFANVVTPQKLVTAASVSPTFTEIPPCRIVIFPSLVSALLCSHSIDLGSRLQAKSAESVARKTYAEAVAPYREACRKAGIACEHAGHRAANISEKVAFLAEKVDKGLNVAIKGKPETEEIISTAALNESINKAAYAYTDTHIGPKEEVGNKGGSLSNRLSAVLAVK